MPSYPLRPFPTVREVIEKAERAGATVGRLECSLLGPRGATEVRFLEREDPRDLDIGLDLG